MIPIANVDLGDEEIEAVVEVLESGYLRQGERTAEFEEMFAEKMDASHAIAVSSGTAALHMAYLTLINEGDEVLVPSFSHISTASMVDFAGGTPIFCDIDERRFTIDLDSAANQITPGTEAIVPVHLFGNACDIDAVTDFADEHGLSIVWDCAQAHRTRYQGKDVGSYDDIATYSFYPTKNMTTSEGGMIVTNCDEIDRVCRLLRSHWQTDKYYHPDVGFNYRMTDIAAAIGIQQLKKLDEFNRKRRENATFLTRFLKDVDGIVTPLVPDGIEHTFHQYTILIEPDEIGRSRDEFSSELETEGVESAVHYPRPIHEQPAFEAVARNLSLPVSEDLSDRILSLPVHPWLEQQHLEQIVDGVRRTVEHV